MRIKYPELYKAAEAMPKTERHNLLSSLYRVLDHIEHNSVFPLKITDVTGRGDVTYLNRLDFYFDYGELLPTSLLVIVAYQRKLDLISPLDVIQLRNATGIVSE